MNEHINYQIIKHAGKPAFAVVSYEDFLRLYPQAEEEKDVPHEVVKAMIYNDISRIRAWREHLGFTQKEVALKMKITQAALSQMEAVGAKPRKATLDKLAKILNLKVEQLR